MKKLITIAITTLVITSTSAAMAQQSYPWWQDGQLQNSPRLNAQGNWQNSPILRGVPQRHIPYTSGLPSVGTAYPPHGYGPGLPSTSYMNSPHHYSPQPVTPPPHHGNYVHTPQYNQRNYVIDPYQGSQRYVRGLGIAGIAMYGLTETYKYYNPRPVYCHPSNPYCM